MRPALFLDRDGTIIEDRDYAFRIEDCILLPGVVEALRRSQELGFSLIIATNQSGVARGYFTENEVAIFHEHLSAEFAKSGIQFDGIYSCFTHPRHGIGMYQIDSPLRKPHPGMLLQAAKELQIDLVKSYMIGDKKSDILAGKRAGCRTVLVQTGKGGRDEIDEPAEPDRIAATLSDAVDWIESQIAKGINSSC